MENHRECSVLTAYIPEEDRDPLLELIDQPSAVRSLYRFYFSPSGDLCLIAIL